MCSYLVDGSHPIPDAVGHILYFILHGLPLENGFNQTSGKGNLVINYVLSVNFR